MSISEETTGSNLRRGRPGVRAAWRALRPTLRMVQVRLRIPLVLVICGLVVGRWDVIRAYWDRFTRGIVAEDLASEAVSNDTEYFCPMDPGVVSDWPGRCGVCNMALVRRRRGEAVALPDGVVARMQLSPYRVQLAGIRTSTIEYRPLACEAKAAAVVGRGGPTITVALEFATRAAPWIKEGLSGEITCDDLPGHGPFAAHVAAVSSLDDSASGFRRTTLAIEDRQRELQPGMVITARLRMPIAELEPFRSLPAGPPPLRRDEPRLAHLCPDHPETVAIGSGRCAIDRNPLEPTRLADHQRLRWWCPMHPDVTAVGPGSTCPACGGMALQPRIVTYRPPGQVLAVPESAVVATGTQTVVFVESMPGMFDAVEVALGPRCGAFCPVVRGLQAGQKVVTSGAFLLDAETRLNPSLAASYFGAGRGGGEAGRPSATSIAPTSLPSALDRLASVDRALAERQKVCPVTRKPLGSMGTPHRVTLSGRVVFLCCEGCEEKLRSDPLKYLAQPQPAPSP
jgi:hypothetical protein